MDNFRQTVDPSFRRKTNKDVVELTNLRLEYEKCKTALDEANRRLEREREVLDQVTANLEFARDGLSEVQAEIDADYLPEGAQPRKRIQDRDSLLLVSLHHVPITDFCFSSPSFYIACTTRRGDLGSSKKDHR